MPQFLAILLAATLIGGLALAGLCGTRTRARRVRIAAATAGMFLILWGVGDSFWIGTSPVRQR